MTESMEMLERRIEELRASVRRAATAGDRALAGELRAELRSAERAWDDALARLEDEQPAALADQRLAAPEEGQPAAGNGTTARGLARTLPEGGGAPHVVHRAATAPVGGPLPPAGAAPGGAASAVGAAPGGAAPGEAAPGEAAAIRRAGPLLPTREQVHQALTLLAVPAAPKLVSAVHEAFFAGAIPSARLTSLRRDEERSFRSAPFARPYYLCAALTAELLSPARGLLAVSTWPMERRVIGPLSPRVHYLSAAIRVAESFLRIRSPGPAAQRLLWRFAANIPGAADGAMTMDPEAVARAAQAELQVHSGSDRATRAAAADRARRQLTDAEQLFGSRLQLTRQAGAGGA